MNITGPVRLVIMGLFVMGLVADLVAAVLALQHRIDTAVIVAFLGQGSQALTAIGALLVNPGGNGHSSPEAQGEQSGSS